MGSLRPVNHEGHIRVTMLCECRPENAQKSTGLSFDIYYKLNLNFDAMKNISYYLGQRIHQEALRTPGLGQFPVEINQKYLNLLNLKAILFKFSFILHVTIHFNSNITNKKSKHSIGSVNLHSQQEIRTFRQKYPFPSPLTLNLKFENESSQNKGVINT